MSKLWVPILVLALIGLACAGDCFGEDCTYSAKGDPEKELTIAEIIPIVDKEVRRVYWYYLRRARLTYQANIEIPERSIHFFIYRNIVGTFLMIASWNKASQESEINTFVRLGNGYSKDIQTPYSPVDIHPFIISLRLTHGEFLIELDEDGQFKVNGKVIENQEDKEDPVIDLDVKTALIDEHVRKHYWYYLRGAELVHKEGIITTQRVYSVITYINIVGTFLVIGSCNKNDVIQVNTFVRLGAGSRNPEEMKPIEIKPSVIDLN